MKYLSIDCEMTGLDPDTCQIIEIAAIIDDLKDVRPLEELPKYHCYVKRPIYQGQPHALAMHEKILRKLAATPIGHNYVVEEYVSRDFNNFLRVNDMDGRPFTVAGKNFGSFDKIFLDRLPGWKDQIKIKHRILDPAVLYFDPLTDDSLPSMNICLDRANIKESVSHNAMDDALQIIKLIRRKLVEEYDHPKCKCGKLIFCPCGVGNGT